jgi:hypothetical protein
VHALAEMEGVKGRDQFIKQASFAENERDAFFFQRVAEMMLGYHIHVKPITEIIPVRSFVAAYTVEKNIIVTLPVDYLYWTGTLEIGAEALLTMSVDRPFKQKELWLTGKVSPAAWEQLENKGIVVKERQREVLLPPVEEEVTEEEEKAEKKAKKEAKKNQ